MRMVFWLIAYGPAIKRADPPAGGGGWTTYLYCPY